MKPPFNASFFVSLFALIVLVYGTVPFQASHYRLNSEEVRAMAQKFYALESTSCGDGQCYTVFSQFPPFP